MNIRESSSSRRVRVLLLIMAAVAMVLVGSSAVFADDTKGPAEPPIPTKGPLYSDDSPQGKSQEEGAVLEQGAEDAEAVQGTEPVETLEDLPGAREGVVLVAFAPGTQKAAMSRAGEQSGAALAQANLTSSDVAVPFAEYKSDTLTTEELMARFRGMPGVVAVSPDGVERIAETGGEPVDWQSDITETIAPAPNDPYFGAQWALEQWSDYDIDVRTAWGYTYGSSDVVVAVLDTGVDYNHPDLWANMWHNPGEVRNDGVDNDSNGYVDDYYGVDTCTYDGHGPDGDPWDEHTHGTHVAGTIAASTGNNKGVAGVAPGARIMAVRVLGQDGFGYQSDIIAGINYIVDMKVNHGINVVAINASLSGSTYNSVYEAAVQAAGNAGILFCAAAGNDTLNLDSYPRYPAAFGCANIISVGATDDYDDRSWFSNYSNTQVDLFAPGEEILSTVTEEAGYFPDTEWWTWKFYDNMENGSGNWSRVGWWATTGERYWPPPAPGHSMTDSPYTDYPNDANWTLTSRTMDMRSLASTGALLRFGLRWDLEEDWDYLHLRVSGDGGATWKYLDTYTGFSDTTLTYEIPKEVLTRYFKIGFLMKTDYSFQYDGVYIDNVTIAAPASYTEFQGTSMATPHVAGTVALMAAEAPWQSVATRKSKILGTTDYRSWLAPYCVSDGRLNAGAAVASSAYSTIEQTDSRLTYLGKWASYSTWYASGGSYYATSTPGDAVTIKFAGPSVSLMARTTAWYGKASVTIDGSSAGTIDFYSPTTRYKNLVYSAGEKTNASHTITIKCLNSKNTASVGYGMSVDAFRVWGTMAQATAPTRYQQDHTNIEYMGPWATSGTNWSASGGTYAGADAPGSSVNVKFTGTYCAWVARTTPWYGKAKVVLDGDIANAVTVDLWSPSIQYKKIVYSTGLIASATHTLSIYWTGDKNGASWGTGICTDTFDIMGTIADAPAAAAIQWRYQETDSRLTYVGSWESAATWSASGGSFRSTAQTGAGVVMKFKGTEVHVLARTTPWYGKAEITLDGAVVKTADLYSAGIAYKVPIYDKIGLSDTVHTLTIKCLGTKNASSAGHSISLDAADIKGYLNTAPAAQRIQETDAKCSYSGAWTLSSLDWSASGGYYKSTDATNATVTVTFKGTSLSWLSRSTPWYGKALVTVDGNTAGATTVDLYSSSVVWKKPVFETGLLTGTTHTVVIKCLGQKYIGSWGYGIAVDAFDVVLTP